MYSSFLFSVKLEPGLFFDLTNRIKMSFLKKVNSTLLIKKEHNFKIIYRTFCNKKGKNDEEESGDVKKSEAIKKIYVNKAFGKKPSENLSDFLESDKEIIAVTEREKDACVQSKLSKESEKLTQGKLFLTSSGLNLSLEIDKDKPAKPILDDIDIHKHLKKTVRTPLIPILDPSDIKIPKGDEPPAPFKRLLRLEPGKVVFGFVPKEWVDAFIPKTGVSGFYTFLVTVGTFLISKELYILEHNYYNGLSMGVLVWASVKYVGPHLAYYLDKEVNEHEKMLEQERVNQKKLCNESIDQELFLQFQIEGQLVLVEAKRENVALQLEEEFRKRQMEVYKEVKKRLDYQVYVTNVWRRFLHKNLIDYVLKEVLKALTPEMHSQLMDSSIRLLILELEKDVPYK